MPTRPDRVAADYQPAWLEHLRAGSAQGISELATAQIDRGVGVPKQLQLRPADRGREASGERQI
jgi:hypothetical protein